MADKNNHYADTQEINSILEEAKKYSQENEPQTRIVYEELEENDNNIKEEYYDINESATYRNHRDEMPKKKVSKKSNKKNNKKGKIALLIGIGVVAIALIGFLVWYFFLSGSSTKIANNIFVDGVELSGMTQKQAEDELKKHETKLEESIKINVQADDKAVELTKADFKYTFNTKDIMNEIVEYSKERGFKTEKKEYTIKLTFDPESCKTASDKVAKELDREPKNAEVTSWSTSDLTFEIEEGVNGIKIQTDKLATSLGNFTKEGKVSGDLKADSEILEPKYSKDYLSKNITKMSSFSTYSTNSWAGNSNMATSLEACNGSIINPGETWSFNDCTGDTNLTSNGYKEAGVIVKGKHEVGVGGGICQSSTTIYNAGLLGGLDVEERSCHYYKSSYVDAGRDATVDYGNLDLKMSNPNDYQIFLKCYMEDVTLYAEIYSIPNEKWDEITVSSEVTSHFDKGYRAATTRTFWKNDEAIYTEDLPNSTYYTSAPDGDTDDVNSYDNGGSEADEGDSGSGSSGAESSGDSGETPGGGEVTPPDDGGGEVTPPDDGGGETP